MSSSLEEELVTHLFQLGCNGLEILEIMKATILEYQEFEPTGLDIQKVKIALVNKLIENSFGKGYQGDTKIELVPSDWGYYEKVRCESEKLSVISKPQGISRLALEPFVAGSLNEDGSVIKVRLGDKWRKKAQKYAQLYEQFFGEEAGITQTENYFDVV